MNPGRKLDALVAEKVMGWALSNKESIKDGLIYTDRGWTSAYPSYSTDIAAAWEVVEKFRWAEPELSWNDETHSWIVHFQKGMYSGYANSAETAPHAICLAALKAIGVQV